MNEYNMKEHAHNFACWTAARASQRGWKKYYDIRKAIDASNIRLILHNESTRPRSLDTFNVWHKETALNIKKDLNADNKDYGRISKIIAIYLKTCVLIPEGNNKFTKIIHPPIDKLLLNNLSKSFKKTDKDFSNYLQSLSWTKFCKNDYQNLIDKFIEKNLHNPSFRMLEKYWIL